MGGGPTKRSKVSEPTQTDSFLSSEQRKLLTPGIDRFVERITRDYEAHPGPKGVGDLRRIAQLVREPWTEGGPEMACTRDLGLMLAGAPVRIRIHEPSLGHALPAVIYVHGGGWVLFNVDTHDRLMREYAARAGVVVIGIDYSLAPEAVYPQQLNELVAVFDWVRDGGAVQGIAPSGVFFVGDSAGGNLSVATALRLRDRGDDVGLVGLVLNYGAFDPETETGSYRRYGSGEYLLAGGEMRDFWLTYVGDTSRFADPYIAAVRAELRGLPPTFMVIAEHDVLRDENLIFAERLRRAGVRVDARVYPGTVHSFLEAAPIAPIADRALDETAEWLRRVVLWT